MKQGLVNFLKTGTYGIELKHIFKVASAGALKTTGRVLAESLQTRLETCVQLYCKGGPEYVE
jgi:hypothetical protein